MQNKVNVDQLRKMVREEVKDLTPEQKQEQVQRMYRQKMESFTMGIVYNAVQGTGLTDPEKGRQIVSAAIAMSEEMLMKLHGIGVERKEA